MSEEPITIAAGITVNTTGKIILRYIDSDGQRRTLDLTAEINAIVDQKIAEKLGEKK